MSYETKDLLGMFAFVMLVVGVPLLAYLGHKKAKIVFKREGEKKIKLKF